MKAPVKQTINDIYQDIALSQEEIATIRASVPIAKTTKPNSHKITYSLLALACTVMLSVGVMLASPNINPAALKLEAIVTDVVDNHLSHKNLQYNTSSLSELSQRFNYLGFLLSTSQPLTSERHGTLIGARPCFILNIPAAQLRYEKNKRSWSTIFQTRYQKSIYGPIPDIEKQEKPFTKIERGVQVSLWRDKGLLFAVAEVQHR